MTALPRLGPRSRQSPALLCPLAFRFKVFADYEAYIKCQGQVDQLFMVRAAPSPSGRSGGSWAECAPGDPFSHPTAFVGHGAGRGGF